MNFQSNELSLNEIESLLHHEADYFGMLATCEFRSSAWHLECALLPDYGDVNRAIRVRDYGSGSMETAEEILTRFTQKSLKPVVDIDPVGESQGLFEAFQGFGLFRTQPDRVLMRWNSSASREPQAGDGIEIVRISDSSADKEEEQALWVETAVSDDLGTEWESLWRIVATHETKLTGIDLYLAFLNGRPAGCCSLFSKSGLGRVDSVITRKGFRRRGVAAALVRRAISDSLKFRNSDTYLVTECGSPAECLYRKIGFETWRVNFLIRLST